MLSSLLSLCMFLEDFVTRTIVSAKSFYNCHCKTLFMIKVFPSVAPYNSLSSIDPQNGSAAVIKNFVF